MQCSFEGARGNFDNSIKVSIDLEVKFEGVMARREGFRFLLGFFIKGEYE